jgi:hypothetical protein
MKAYKGFNKDMTCRGFQYEEGKEYTCETAQLCESGFHACERPLDVFGYYSPASSVVHEVFLDEVSDERQDDTKVAAKKIKIGARLNITDLCKAQFEFVKNNTTIENTDTEIAAAGDDGAAAAGYSGSAAAGDSGSAAAGYSGAAAAGYDGAAAAGDRGAAEAGYRGAAAAGYSGAAEAGDRGAAESRGSI